MTNLNRARKAVEEIDGTTFSGSREEVREKMAEIVARNFPEKDGWIPCVKGKEPKGWVLVNCVYGDDELSPAIDVCQWEHPTWCNSGGQLYSRDEITHWRPLPAPPKEGAQK